MPRKRRPWHKTVTEAGVAVHLFERVPGSVLYREVWTDGARDRKSLGHRDRQLAQTQARALARRLAELRFAGQTGSLTLGQLAALFLTEQLPQLAPKRQTWVKGAIALLVRHFGRGLLVDDLSQHAVDGYVKARRAGTLRSPRHRVPDPGVRAGTIRNEIHVLTQMLRWARTTRRNGRRLLALDPLEGLQIPQELNPRRPVATEARYQQLLAVADQVDPAGRFRLTLAIARLAGRRLNAICQLRASDVLLTRAQVEAALAKAGQDLAHAAEWTEGAIRWAATTDKRGFGAVAPIARPLRRELERYLAAHPRLGDAPLLPSSGDPDQAMKKALPEHWLRRAEQLADLPKMERGAWHAFRRLWASERRHLPDQDVAAAGGWRSLEVMRTSYQQPDAAMVRQAVENPGKRPHRPTSAAPRRQAKR